MLDNDIDLDDQAALDTTFIEVWSDDGRPRVLNAAISLLWSDSARTAISSLVVSKILGMLEHRSRQLCLDALHAISTLVQYAKIRIAICSSPNSSTECSTSILNRIVVLLRHKESTIQHSAHDAVMALGLHDDARAAIFSGDSFFEVASLLHTSLCHHGEPHPTVHQLLHCYNVSPYICDMIPAVISGLEDGPRHMGPNILAALILIMQYTKTRVSISPDVISQIGALLAHPKWIPTVHRLSALIVLMQYDELRPYFPFSQTMSRIIPLLTFLEESQDSEDRIIPALLAYLAYNDVQNLPSTVEQIVQSIRGYKDHKNLKLLEGILRRDGAVPLLGPILCHKVFSQLQHSPNVGSSYADLILMLPNSFDISSDDMALLVATLRDPNAHSLQCCADIVMHFAPNDRFRTGILRANILSICLSLLRCPNTTAIALAMIIEFSRYDDIREHLIKTVEIVHELVVMMTGRQWEHRHGGLKALLALDLFRSHPADPQWARDIDFDNEIIAVSQSARVAIG
ncbi:hypothetical protein DFH06DRAFT_170133 [Mycena polygramma]|nr:hypothetical protein DFH06DRAFT_170133 [Mycena polygramma]